MQDFIHELFRTNTAELEQWVNKVSRDFRITSDAVDSSLMRDIVHDFGSTELPADPQDMRSFLSNFEKNILIHGSHLGAPTYLGHMTTPLPLFMSELGKLVNTFNQNLMKAESSRGLTFLERQVLGILHRCVFGFDDAFYARYLQDPSVLLASFTSGGTLANITALWMAANKSIGKVPGVPRWKTLVESGWSDAVVIGSELMHYSFDKGADLLGLSLIKIPVNASQQLDLDALRTVIKQCDEQKRKIVCLVGIGGTTDFGSVDPLKEICQIGHERGIHVHVDAAWGGSLLLSRTHRHILSGIEDADTVTIDAHKQLMLPIGSGMLFIRNPQDSSAIMHHAPYAVRPSSVDQGRFTIEGTRPAMALYLYAALHLIGQKGYQALLDASVQRAQLLAKKLKEDSYFELAADPVMNIVLYRVIPPCLQGKESFTDIENDRINQFNVLLQKHQRQAGKTFVSRTMRKMQRYGNKAIALLRAVLLNPLTTATDLDMLLSDQKTLADQLGR